MNTAAVAPLVITQDNCLAACGIEPRRFLALIHDRQIKHTKLGKLRLVRADVLLAALDAVSCTSAPEQTEAPEQPSNRFARAAGLA